MISEKNLLAARNSRAAFFKDRRIELDLTQLQLAEKCGWHQETIARMEAGKFFINEKQLLTLAAALDVDVKYIPKEENKSNP